jgi:pyrimidine operon attenuation protein/uracil phosphoribosyltransferase
MPHAQPSVSRRVLDADQIGRAIIRIAHEIIESAEDDMRLIGVRTRGVPMAGRLAQAVREAAGIEVPLGSLDINLYRDDLTTVAAQPVVRPTELGFPIDDTVVILVDDVLYTGRTTRAAMDALADLGRPRKIRLAVLIDRGHRELPIRADYVGRNIPTARDEKIRVRFTETDGVDDVLIERKEASA